MQPSGKPISVIVENGRSACGLRVSRGWQTADLESSHWAGAQGPEMWMTRCPEALTLTHTVMPTCTGSWGEEGVLLGIHGLRVLGLTLQEGHGQCDCLLGIV